uniref:Uncharacterized protein n=1 Tax=Avena sativa TaxID=4498 RepID=A0ACD5YYT1_AVESA
MGKRNNCRQVLLTPRKICAGAMGKKGNTDDRLSALPDDILVNILDRLNVPEAARTSVLSRRWSQLSAELSRLVINAQDFVPEGVSSPEVSGHGLVRMNAAAVEATKNILTRRNPGEHTISLLSTTFYLRDVVPVSIGHAVEGCIFCWHEMVELSTLLFETSVVELNLGFRYEKIWVQPECLTKRLASAFHRLRIANLDSIPEGYDLMWTMFILEAAPSLEKLCMTVMDHPCEMQMDDEERRKRLYSENKGVEWESASSTSNFKHHHLTKLIIFCFESCMVSYVRRVMRAAVNLKDVYLYDRLTCDECEDLEPLKPTTFPLSKKHRCSMRKQMTQGFESHARIRFLSSAETQEDHEAMILN